MKRSRLKRVNRERARKRRERDFGPKAEWVSGLHCAFCAVPPPSDPMHVRSRGAVSGNRYLLPACRRCHQESHQVGILTFAKKSVGSYFHLLRMVDEYHERWVLSGE